MNNREGLRSPAMSENSNHNSSPTPPGMTRRGFLKGVIGLGAAAFGARHFLGEGPTTLEAAPSITEALGPVLLTQQELETSPQEIRSHKFTKDANGNLNASFALHKNRFLYKYEMDPVTGKAKSEYKTTSPTKIPMENVLSLHVANDGQFIMVGGEDPIRTGQQKVAASSDGGKTWQNIEFNFPASGGIIDILPVAGDGTKYLLNCGNFDGAPASLYIATVEPGGGANKITLKATTIKSSVSSTSISGRAHDLGISTFDAATNKIRAVSNGSFTLGSGLNVYDIDAATGNGTVENISMFKINGLDINVGFLDGRAEYTDASGDLHVLSSNTTGGVFYDLNVTKRTGTEFNYEYIMDTKNISDATRVAGVGTIHIVDSQIYAGGAYMSKRGGTRPLVMSWPMGVNPELTPDKMVAFPLISTQGGGIDGQNDTVEVRINGKRYWRLNCLGLGEALLAFNGNGTPDPTGTFIFPDKGLGKSPDAPTPTPTPQPPTEFRVNIPIASNGAKR